MLRSLLRHWKLVVAFFLGMFSAFFFIGFTHLSFNLTGTNEFCGKCHEMLPQVNTWKMSSHTVNPYGVIADCVDCHLPPGGLHHYTYKAYSGLRDVVVHYLGDPDKIDWAAKSGTKHEYLFEGACLACHQDLTPGGMNRGGFLAHREWRNGRTVEKCWDCHAPMVHHNAPVLYSHRMYPSGMVE
jgi:cytochrome c nitrite reductase small subunit